MSDNEEIEVIMSDYDAKKRCYVVAAEDKKGSIVTMHLSLEGEPMNYWFWWKNEQCKYNGKVFNNYEKKGKAWKQVQELVDKAKRLVSRQLKSQGWRYDDGISGLVPPPKVQQEILKIELTITKV